MQTIEEKKLFEYDPPELIIKADALRHVIEHDELIQRFIRKKASSLNYFLIAVSTFVTAALNLLSWNSLTNIFKIIDVAFVLIALVAGICFLSLFNSARNELNNYEINEKGEGRSSLLTEELKKNTSYSTIILIGTKDDLGPIKFLCRKSDAFLEHCVAKKDESIDGNKKTLIQHLDQQYGVTEDEIIDVYPLENGPFFSVKQVHGETMSNAFLFYCVQFHKKAKEKVFDRVKKSKELEWLSIEEMKSNPKAMKNNYDIISVLDQNNGRLPESFPNEQLHVIWNITKRCGYNCAICATRDEKRQELSCEQKYAVLSALSRERDRIRSIDFAGGDPCADSESRGVIETAIAIFGQKSIGVTTTAKAIEQLPQNEKVRILRNCEITIDASHESLRSDGNQEEKHRNHRGSNYSRSNRENIPLFSDVVKHLTINIPILDADLSDKEIESLIDIIKKIKQDNREMSIETHLIRLMRVGSSAQSVDVSVYQSYNPVDVAKKIYSSLTSIGIKCSYHCSLRILSAIGNGKEKCTMMKRKIGIDCAGNVFACAWGGYLPDTAVADNPLFLGNLLRQDLRKR